MSHWQTGKLELKCSLNILRKALINLMPEWEAQMQVDENGGLSASYHNGPVKQKYQIVIRQGKVLYSDIGVSKNKLFN